VPLADCFGGIYAGKTVLVTGHTGFKGSWLSVWLTALGARVIGYSAYLPSEPCNFQACGLEGRLSHNVGDIRNLERLVEVIRSSRPDVIFHLAAQPIVRTSYDLPKETFDTNAGGTLNVLECLRLFPEIKAGVFITSDKCYRNVEWPWGYRENDELGGDDPYSASKACAELTVRSYAASFFSESHTPRISTARAGNVIGGGDWAKSRIVPDCMRAWSKGERPVIRSPRSTRPWQHVLEPLSGYLWLGANLLASPRLRGESFNFGPDAQVNQSVQDLLRAFKVGWEGADWIEQQESDTRKESALLKLCCDKALHSLGWHAILGFDETVAFTVEWYRAFYSGHADMHRLSFDQVEHYSSIAAGKKLAWATGKTP
jgi:CDP-glucose 4,6-dehydratase